MFERHGAPIDKRVTVYIDEHAVEVPAAISVAGALLVIGHMNFRRTPVTGSPRGPWCLMGSCFDCMVDIDGVSGCQACSTTVHEGMRISRPGPLQYNTENPDPWGAGPMNTEG